MVEGILKEAMKVALVGRAFVVEDQAIILEHPTDSVHGDYSCNIAMLLAKKAGENPHVLAERIIVELDKNKPDEIEKIEVAGPGFINFYLSREFFIAQVKNILKQGKEWGRNDAFSGQKVMVEYTDPNPFKVFHIGHLMPNIIGEALVRLFEFSGATVKRANYQGDVGLHVAKAVWGMRFLADAMPGDTASLSDKVAFLGQAYTLGSEKYESDKNIKEEIDMINRQVYEKSDVGVNLLYEKGRQWSLDHFETIYAILGTKFDFYFFESQTAKSGVDIVREYLDKGVFEESEGAIVFRGEKYALHTRVFLTSAGLPPYEAKDLALSKLKQDTYPYDLSVVVTANEQTPYWQVVKKAMSFVYPELAEKTKHVGHGLLVLPIGKMSSRKGNVITGESLLSDSVATAFRKVQEGEGNTGDLIEQQKLAEQIGVGALKYSILKQSLGKNIVYEKEKSFSLEGDSGPYLQYACVRARSVLAKAEVQNMESVALDTSDEVVEVERMLYQFPEVVIRALKDFEPHHLTTYLTTLAGKFNNYYSTHKILDEGDKTPYRLAITKAVVTTLENGLYILGISVPERM